MFFYGQHSRLLPKAGVPLLGAPLYRCLSWGFLPFPELPFISTFTKMHWKQLPPRFPRLPGYHCPSCWPVRSVVSKPAQGFHWLNMGDGSVYKNTCSISLAMHTLTQKGSSPEASLLPVGSSTGGEWLFVCPLSLRVSQTSFRDLTGFYPVCRCQCWTRNYAAKER